MRHYTTQLLRYVKLLRLRESPVLALYMYIGSKVALSSASIGLRLHWIGQITILFFITTSKMAPISALATSYQCHKIRYDAGVHAVRGPDENEPLQIASAKLQDNGAPFREGGHVSIFKETFREILVTKDATPIPNDSSEHSRSSPQTRTRYLYLRRA